MSNTRRALATLAAALLATPLADAGDLTYTGVNLAGAEFGHHIALPGEHGKHYSYPTPAEVDYFVGKGFNCFRLPFAWERLQRTLNAKFDATEFERLDGFVRYATAKGAHVVLDPHNYARYHGTIIGTGDVTDAHFADFWTRLANHYKGNDKVIFGLVNEPHGMPSTEHWVTTANAAIAAIRDTGARNLILVPGNAWSGAHSWNKAHYGTPNGVALLKIVDPGDNYAFDVHQYLDADSSGTKDVIVNADVGVERLRDFTAWLKEHGRRGFLGEFAVSNAKFGDGPDQIGDEAIDGMLAHMEANADVWLGWTWWAAGPRWGNYMFSIEPTNLGKPDQADRPAMSVLERHLTGVTGRRAGDAAAVDGRAAGDLTAPERAKAATGPAPR
jgi:endoglucanase